MNIGVLASGRGSNFRAIAEGIKKGECSGKIKVLITDNPKAGAIEIAKEFGIPYEIVLRKKFKSREEMDLKILGLLEEYDVELVVLAGYMRILKAKELFEKYKYKIINIHPSLLPAFKGSTHAQKDAFEYGCKVSGLTIHFVTPEVDAGPIIFQYPVDISACKTPEEVAQKILKYEHEFYKKIVDSFSKGEYKINGRRVEYIKK